MNIAILGAGTWGTALAKTLADAGNNVKVWSIIKEEVDELNNTRKHKNLPGMTLPEDVVFTNDLVECLDGGKLVIIATPSVFVRSTAKSILPLLKEEQIIGCVAKGLEENTLYTMSEVIEDVVGDKYSVVAISGPTHAEEVARDIPTTIVCASKDEYAAKEVQHAFVGTCIRPYTNDDIKGVELSGALKNIIALACGVSTGLGYGDNTKAALITRGLAEIRNLGNAMGCKDSTFAGLAGIGDLIVTATSIHSRNNRCGMLIGQGVPPHDAVKQIGMVVEGINALAGARALAKKYNVSLPIIEGMGAIVDGTLTPHQAVDALLNRTIKAE